MDPLRSQSATQHGRVGGSGQAQLGKWEPWPRETRGEATRRTGGSRAGQLRLTSIELVDRAHVDVGARACLPGTELWEADATRLSTDPLKRKRSTKPDQSSAWNWILHVCLSTPPYRMLLPFIRIMPYLMFGYFHFIWIGRDF